MKKSLLFCVMCCLALVATAQKNYFLYLQTDDQSPFYVRMADKIYSSSTAGYLILPNLSDTTYQIGIGFPKSTAPETRFAVNLNQNDRGYLLKNFSDGLSLFDIQELTVLKPVSANKDNTVYQTKTDKFSAVLSKAADDPSLLKVPVAKKEEPKAEPEKKEPVIVGKEETKPEPKETTVAKAEEKKSVVEKKKDTVSERPIETVQTKVDKKEDQTKSEQQVPQTNAKVEDKQSSSREASNATPLVHYMSSVVVRRAESSTTEGFGIVYLDKMDDRTDTIRILIPPSKFKLDQDSPAITASEAAKKTEATSSGNEPVKTNNTTSPSDSHVASLKENTTTDKGSKAAATASCKELASDKDFMKLRKNMAAKSSDEDMVFEAKKAFRLRCYTSEQIRYLSTLFLTAAAKYQFFDAAFGFVSDKENFASLQSEIKDDYYLKRFKALIGE